MPPETQQPIGEKAIELLALGLDLLEGKPGPQGERGDKGDTGEKGDKGEDSTVAGPKGDKGDAGKDGIDGKDGHDGKDGTNGKDGKDGKQGKKGDTGEKGEDAPTLDIVVESILPTVNQSIHQQIVKHVSSKTYSANEIEGLTEFVQENSTGVSTSFETVSKNLDASGSTLSYTGDNLTSIEYTNGIVKTLNYTGENLTSVVLSGSTPSGISLTKTLSYTGDNLTGVAYS